MVTWSGPAKRDLRQIHNYIAKDSKYYAKNVTQNIVAKTERLKDFPEIGSSRNRRSECEGIVPLFISTRL
jgi:plasmid stabilization system protein ParE